MQTSSWNDEKMIDCWDTRSAAGSREEKAKVRKSEKNERESEMVRKSEVVPKPQCAPVAKWQRFCTALLQKSQHFEKRPKIHFKK